MAGMRRQTQCAPLRRSTQQGQSPVSVPPTPSLTVSSGSITNTGMLLAAPVRPTGGCCPEPAADAAAPPAGPPAARRSLLLLLALRPMPSTPPMPPPSMPKRPCSADCSSMVSLRLLGSPCCRYGGWPCIASMPPPLPLLPTRSSACAACAPEGGSGGACAPGMSLALLAPLLLAARASPLPGRTTVVCCCSCCPVWLTTSTRLGVPATERPPPLPPACPVRGPGADSSRGPKPWPSLLVEPLPGLLPALLPW